MKYGLPEECLGLGVSENELNFHTRKFHFIVGPYKFYLFLLNRHSTMKKTFSEYLTPLSYH